MRRLVLAGAAALALGIAPAAAADSIVYEKDGNVWQAAGDGSNQRQVTTVGGYTKPTQANDGTIVAVKDKLLHRMDRGGRLLNTAGDSSGTGPLTPQLSPNGSLVAYEFFNTGSVTPGRRTALSHATRPTSNDEIFNIGGWGNPSWIGDGRVLMFDASPSFTSDTLIYTVGGGTQSWYEDPDLSLAGGEIDAGATRFAATDGAVIRLYALSGPPPAMPAPKCDVTGPTGSFFRPTWSPSGGSLAWQEDDGVWIGSFDLDNCAAGSARLAIPGAKSPDWGPADVSTPGGGGGGAGTAAPDTAAPRLTARVAKRARRAALLRGLTVTLGCDEPCVVSAELLLDRRTAKRMRLAASKPVLVGRASKRLTRPGTAKVRLRPTAKARKRMRRGRLRSVTVRLRARDGAGNRTRYVTRKVTIRG